MIINKRTLINLVKYNRLFYTLYYKLGNFSIKIMRLFVIQKKNRLVFSSFGGRKYDDSPRCIYEAILQDPRFINYEFVWALENPDAYDIPKANKVKCDTIAYYKTLLSASVWVTNSTMERGLSFKPKSIFNFNTWHGTAIKLMGSDLQKDSEAFGDKGKECHDDIMLAQGHYDVDIFSRVFNIPKKNFRIIGLPRNDELVHCNTEENRRRIRQKIGIKEGKMVILYAPTFREYDKDSSQNCRLYVPITVNKWEEKLGRDYVFLMRAHYEVVKTMQVENSDFFKDVSSYQNLNELMIVSDILVSDYSSIFFDYSIQDKPMLCFVYDYEKYLSKRGMYFDIREQLKCNCNNEDELINAIVDIDTEKAIEITRKFRNNFIEKSGDASIKSADIIWNYLNNRPY